MNMHVAAASASAPAPALPHSRPSRDELQATILDRITKSGRRLWYKLTVIQQPERARACGSGPKCKSVDSPNLKNIFFFFWILTRCLASADRRPVDPPPVVELRIFEGNTWQEAEQKDITFLYNANFFLYATLEHARIIAHGRVQTPAANQPPVLTGMPVSGMAYLDRPSEAGYFLFPDLSVRHEGRYRLTFNLYEETKEDKDKDPDTPDTNIVASGFANATGGSFDFRMEVKSHDFIVFSAKKFPGLAESTQLSRVVAEQGCRVRIRRDVRMRRRDRTKDSDYDHREEEYARRKRTETPEVKSNYRARSMSGSVSVDGTSFSAESQRRLSGAEYANAYPQTPTSAGGHLQFLGNGNAPPYHPQPPSHSRPPSMPPSPSYQTSHGSHFPSVHQSPHQIHQQGVHAQAQAHPAAPQPMHQPAYPPPPPPAAQQQTYGQIERPQPGPFAQSNPSPQRETASREFREAPPPQYGDPAPREFRDAAASSQLYHQPSKEFMLPPFKPMSYQPPPPSQHQAPRGTASVTLPPINDFAKHLPAPRAMAPLTSPTSDRVPQMQPVPPPKLATHLPAPPSVAGSKRSRDDGSRYEVETPRYHNGARENPQLLEEQVEPQLIYRRANGQEILVTQEPGV